jgi:hypothetical protein
LLSGAGADGGFVQSVPAAVAIAYAHDSQGRGTEQGFRLGKFCALCLDLPECYLGSGLVTRTDGVGEYRNIFSPGQKTQRCRLDSTFDCSANQNELGSSQFAEHPVGPRLFEGVYTAFFKYDLIVLPEYVAGQVGASIGSESNVFVAEGVADLFLAFRAVNTETAFGAAAVVNTSGGNHADILEPGPGHNPSDIGENPPMISDAGRAISEKKVPLRINIDNDTFSS